MVTAFKDHYKLLDIVFPASDEEIKKAYRQLARTYHPDLHPDEEERYTAIFQEISGAYEILSDPEAKYKYDADYRIYVLGEGPRYEYVVDETPPDTYNYKHTYTKRNKTSRSYYPFGILLVLLLQIGRMVYNSSPIDNPEKVKTDIQYSSNIRYMLDSMASVNRQIQAQNPPKPIIDSTSAILTK